jgi:threonine synthase
LSEFHDELVFSSISLIFEKKKGGLMAESFKSSLNGDGWTQDVDKISFYQATDEIYHFVDNDDHNRPVREMAPEELAYAEPSSAAAYAAALSAQQHAQSSLGQSMPPPPIVAPVAATQPVVGL